MNRFPCTLPGCTLDFASVRTRNEHVRTQHYGARFECGCGRDFASSSQFYAHRSAHQSAQCTPGLRTTYPAERAQRNQNVMNAAVNVQPAAVALQPEVVVVLDPVPDAPMYLNPFSRAGTEQRAQVHVARNLRAERHPAAFAGFGRDEYRGTVAQNIDRIQVLMRQMYPHHLVREEDDD